MVPQTLHPELPQASILGIPVTLLDMPGTVAAIDQMISAGDPEMVVTANASAVVLAHDDAAFRADVLGAKLITVDGAGIQWALERKGMKNIAKVAGVELVEQLCYLSSDKGYRIFLLGGEPGVAEIAAEKLRLKFPGCNIVGVRNGYFPASDDDIVAQEVAEFQPNILLVGMGMPRQERFIMKTKHITGAPVQIGVGGSFDVLSNKAKRAPEAWQKLRIEWLWRALIQPSKFKKLAALPRFMLMVIRAKS